MHNYSIKMHIIALISFTSIFYGSRVVKGIWRKKYRNVGGLGILERITVVLETLQQPIHNSDVNALVAILEKVAIAMQPPPEQKAITGEAEDDAEEDRNQRIDPSITDAA